MQVFIIIALVFWQTIDKICGKYLSIITGSPQDKQLLL